MRWVEQREAGLLFLRLFQGDREGALVAGMTTRQGGASVGPFQGLNLGTSVGDDPEATAKNRDLFLGALGIERKALASTHQVHGGDVVGVGRAGFDPLGSPPPRTDDEGLPRVDGMVLLEPGRFAVMFFADCFPIFLLEPKSGLGALLHAGWRGTIARVAERGVVALARSTGAPASSILAAIGPGIGPCCFEVGPEVSDQFRVLDTHTVGALSPGSRLVLATRSGRDHVDLPEANRRILVAAGLDPANVKLPPYCTHCRADLFFSHRRDRGQTGRMAAFFGVRAEGRTR